MHRAQKTRADLIEKTYKTSNIIKAPQRIPITRILLRFLNDPQDKTQA